jgi:hypothetical protein
VPKKELKENLILNGFANQNGKPKYVGKFIHLSDYEIIQRFNRILRDFLNYYNLADNRTALSEVIYILEFSLCHTIAAKHRLSLRKVFKKYGKPIGVTMKLDQIEKKVKFDRPTSLKPDYLNRKYLTISSLNNSTKYPEPLP